MTKPISLDASSSSSSSNNVNNPKKWLVVDFDGTCSVKDTTPLLPLLASRLEDNHPNDENEKRRLGTFQLLEKEFFARYQRAKDQLDPQTMSLDTALETLDQVSDCVTEKVSASRVLQGLCVPFSKVQAVMTRFPNDIGQPSQLHKNCVATLTQAVGNDWKLGVLSINWCPSLIEATLVAPVLEQNTRTNDVISTSQIPIWSNKVDKLGEIELLVSGAKDKKERIVAIQKEQQSSIVVYVGDSATDLSALLQANVGILFGDSQSTVSMAQRWGVRTSPLSQRRGFLEEEASADSGTIWTTTSWTEIRDFLTDNPALALHSIKNEQVAQQ